jgi:phospholipid/cholesterol/gamma-HCH transport system substrate-binding protein
MNTNNKRSVIVGMFILVGIIFLSIGILTIGNIRNTFVKKIEISTVIDDANGLKEGNNIWYSGVKIGTVKSLNFFNYSQVRVIMKIDDKAKQYIRKDAKVKISSDGLIGNKIIVIYGGSTQIASIEDGDSLSTEKMVSTEEMLNTLQENNTNILSITKDFKIIAKKLADGEGSVGKLLHDETLYNNINTTLVALNKASLNAEKLSASLSNYAAKLNQKGTLANDLVSDTMLFYNARNILSELEITAANAKTFTENLKTSSSNADSPLGIMMNDKQTADNLKLIIKNLESSAAKLDENLIAMRSSFPFKKYFKKQAKK